MKGPKTKNVIRITAGQEHGILDDQNIMDQESLMYPAFSAALDALTGIVKNSDTWNQRDSVEARKSDGFYGYSNNLLAFCAPRGQGKTSAMLSFSRAIECGDPIQRKCKKLEDIARDHRFRALPPIDPTMLSEGESVIQFVIGKLFREISNLWENPPQGETHRLEPAAQQETQKLNILGEFKACYHGLYRINKQSGREKDTDDFEKMLTASDIFQLKEHLHSIIMYFFQLLGYNSRKSFLLIQLDDTDMQMERAYSILEEVRKYLAMPNVVVLMATHLEQLRMLITQQFAAQLHELPQEGKFGETTYRMAAKYLDKLIPASQAIYLPTMRLQRDTEQRLMLVIEREGEPPTESGDLENEMFAIIYEKTGLAFIRHDNYMHNLLPTTLRGLQHLYRLLNQMETPKKPETVEFAQNEERKRQLREYCGETRVYLRQKYRNLLLFESYFLNDWCSSKIDDKDWTLLKRIDKTALIRRLPCAVQCLNNRKEPEQRKSGCSPTLIWTLSSEEKPNISKILNTIASIEKAKPEPQRPLEDSGTGREDHFIRLVLLLSEEAKRCVTEEDYLFVFAMETYFSIQLNKLAIVDQITSMDDILDQLEKDIFKESQFLYDFSQLAGHLYGDPALPGQITPKEFTQRSEALIDRLKREASNGPKTDHSEDILGLFLSLFFLNDPGLEGRRIEKNAINLQEYAVYICCNLDVLAQVLKKTADLKPEDIESRSTYFQRLKKAIVTDKETRAYPFSPLDSTSLDETLEYLATSTADFSDAANAANETITKNNP